MLASDNISALEPIAETMFPLGMLSDFVFVEILTVLGFDDILLVVSDMV